MKLPKHERVKIIHAIEDTLDNYCRACPQHSTNQTSPVCAKCPINFKLREYGETLSPSKKSRTEIQKPKTWTEEEVKILSIMKGSHTIKEIAFKLNRSYDSVMGKMKNLSKGR